jgi:hypothetical protein
MQSRQEGKAAPRLKGSHIAAPFFRLQKVYAKQLPASGNKAESGNCAQNARNPFASPIKKSG